MDMDVDAEKRIKELELELAERDERDRVKEAELAALRRELELRFAYNGHLEDSLSEARKVMAEQYQSIHRLEALLRDLTDMFAVARDAEQLLLAERSRISYRVTQRIVKPFGRLRRA